MKNGRYLRIKFWLLVIKNECGKYGAIGKTIEYLVQDVLGKAGNIISRNTRFKP
jgi:hypothetical protein